MHFPKTILSALFFSILLVLAFPRTVFGQAVSGNITAAPGQKCELHK